MRSNFKAILAALATASKDPKEVAAVAVLVDPLFRFVGGELAQFKNSQLWWADTFQTSYIIRSV